MKARILQMGFGALGTGGPIGALTRLVESEEYGEKFFNMTMLQSAGLGGFRPDVAYSWSRRIRRFRPDLAHCRGLGNEGFHAVLACRMAGVPRILLSVHGSQSELVANYGVRQQVVSKSIEPLSMLMSTKIATVSEWGKRRPYLKRFEDKIIGSVPNGVDSMCNSADSGHATRSMLRIESSSFLILSVGRMTWEKGHGVLASALDGMSLEGCVLVLVGDGPDRGQIERRYAEIEGLEVIALGQRHDVHELMAASDVLVFPSFHENSPNVIVEALANGLPVVASSVPANAEILGRGGGLTYPPQNAAALARVLQRLRSEPELRSSLSVAGLASHKGFYSRERMVSGWMALYERMLSE